MFKDIHLFLGRFNSIQPPERAVQKEVIKTVERTLGITLRRAEISIKGKTVYLAASPVIRSEIAFHKSKILQELSKNSLLGTKITDIR